MASPSALTSALASKFQIFCFCLKSVSFFEKIEVLCSSLWLTILHRYTLLHIPITLRFPIHPSGVFHWCYRTKAVWISGRIRPLLFWKKAGKTSTLESFLSKLTGLRGTSPESCLEQLFLRERLILQKGTPPQMSSQEFSRFLNSCEEEGCSLQYC